MVRDLRRIRAWRPGRSLGQVFEQGTLTVADALASSDPNVGKLKVVSMLESLPGLGKVKARKIMEEVGIADNRKIQGLGAQQKKALLEHLAK